MQLEVWEGLAEPVCHAAVLIFASSILADVPRGENATAAWMYGQGASAQFWTDSAITAGAL
jgi:hypothetical protein